MTEFDEDPNEFQGDPKDVVRYLETVLHKISSAELMDADDYVILLGDVQAGISEAIWALKSIRNPRRGELTE